MTVTVPGADPKDLRLFFSDRRAVHHERGRADRDRVFLRFCSRRPERQERDEQIPVALVDQDESAISRQVVSRLSAHQALEVNLSTLDSARESVRKGKTTVAAVIPRNFGDDAGRAFFSSAQKPTIGVLYDPSHGVELSMVQGILTGEIMQVVSRRDVHRTSGREVVKTALAQVDQSPLLPPAQKRACTTCCRAYRTGTSNRRAAGTSREALPPAYRFRTAYATRP